MKKIYLSAAAALLCALGAQAGTPLMQTQRTPASLTPLQSTVYLDGDLLPAPRQMRADEQTTEPSIYLGYCGNDLGSAQLFAGEKQKIAIQFSKSRMKEFMGNKIVGVRLFNPCGVSGNQLNDQNTITKAKIFITYNLTVTPKLEAEVELGATGGEWQDYYFDTPYDIDGKALYVGVAYEGLDNTTQCVDLFDGQGINNAYSCWVYSNSDVNSQGYLTTLASPAWKDWHQYVGSVMLKAIVAGDQLPQNTVTPEAYYVAAATNPGAEFPVEVAYTNNSATPITKVQMKVQIQGQEPQYQYADVMVPDYQQNTYVPGKIGYAEQGVSHANFKWLGTSYSAGTPVEISIAAINDDVPNVNADKTLTGSIKSLPTDVVYDQNVVCEELTSIGCGWCVVGITGIQTMLQEVPAGRFLPIAVHCNIGKVDPWNIIGQGQAYYPFGQHTGAWGAPSSAINRDFTNNVYPNYYYLKNSYDEVTSYPSLATIKAETLAGENENEIILRTDTRFAITIDNADYGIAYTLVESGLSTIPEWPGVAESEVGQTVTQTNYCAGGQPVDGDWQNKPQEVAIDFNHVAMPGTQYTGIPESLPTQIYGLYPYKFETKVDVSRIYTKKPSDGVEPNYKLVVMVIDNKTGEIVNATSIENPMGSGVKGVQSETNAAVANGLDGAIALFSTADVYALDGRQVLRGAQGTVAMPAGIYIVRSANGVAKVLVR